MPLFSSCNLNVIYLLNTVESISPLKLKSQWLKGLGFWRASRELKLSNETKVKALGEILKKTKKHLVELPISLQSLFIKHFPSLSF